MTPTLERCRDAADLAARCADRLRALIAAQPGDAPVRIALSGGSTPKRLFEHLARGEGLPWDRVALFWGDERGVGPEHEASNFRMTKEALLDHVPLAADRVHRIEGERDDAAARYAEVLGGSPLDLVLLGMGTDGHCASLFPGGPELESRDAVVETTSPAPPARRISLTLPTLNAAATAILLVSGERKATMLRRAWDEIQRGKPVLPVAMVAPRDRLIWMVDEAAASELEQETSS